MIPQELMGYLFDGFCSALGCGGSAGLTMLGLFILGVIVFIAYKIDMGLDGAVLIGSITFIALVQGGMLFPWFSQLTYIVFGVIIAIGLYKVVRG